MSFEWFWLYFARYLQQQLGSSRSKSLTVGFQAFECRLSHLVLVTGSWTASRGVRISGHWQVDTIISFMQRLPVYQTPSAICHTPPFHTLTPSQPLLAPAIHYTTQHYTAAVCVTQDADYQYCSSSSPSHYAWAVRVQPPLNSSWEQQSHLFIL